MNAKILSLRTELGNSEIKIQFVFKLYHFYDAQIFCKSTIKCFFIIEFFFPIKKLTKIQTIFHLLKPLILKVVGDILRTCLE